MSPDARPYTRDELLESDGRFPERGLYCRRCRTYVPVFADLEPDVAAAILAKADGGEPTEAMADLQAVTGCPARWAKVWVLHRGKPSEGPPCPRCGKPLRTERARQCLHCGLDWHEPSTG